MKKQLLALGIPAAFALGSVACSDSTAGTVSLALSTVRPPAPVLAPALAASASGSPLRVAAAGDSTIIAVGNDTIILRSVEVVLREIELERVEVVECDSISGNGDCEKFETGPVLVTLPLGSAATVTEVAIDAAPGRYNELEFDIHKPDEVDDAAFIAAHAAFADVSIRVTGTFSQGGTRSDFTYTTDLNEEQEIALDPPLTVSEGATTNVTLRLDVSTWFLSGAADALVDPATANKGGTNENLVRDNIRASIDAFRDDDRDGLDDDHEAS